MFWEYVWNDVDSVIVFNYVFVLSMCVELLSTYVDLYMTQCQKEKFPLCDKQNGQ